MLKQGALFFTVVVVEVFSAHEFAFRRTPPNFPLGEVQDSSGISLVFTLFIALSTDDSMEAANYDRVMLHVVIHRELVGMRAEAKGVVFFLFHLNPVRDEVFVENVAFEQEGMVEVQSADGATERIGDARDVR